MDTIKEMRKALRKCITDWKHDDCHPPNHIREDGMGTELARVDVWCGGFQDVHNPAMIGWRARRGSSLEEGVVLTADYADKEAAITEAKRLADAALEKLR